MRGVDTKHKAGSAECRTAGREDPLTCGLQVVSFVRMFVEEEVVTRRLFRDSQWQVLHLRWLSAAQPNQLLFGIY